MNKSRISMVGKKQSFNYDDLLSCARGEMFGDGNPQLPLPPMLMFDRITKIADEGGSYQKGVVEAEFDVNDGLWFFSCHFKGDPVMPGCLGLDAMWQLLGFYLGWLGLKGRGRAFGVGEVKFSQMVVPSSKLISYKVNVKRVINRKIVLGIADAELVNDGTVIYTAKNLRVGLFEDD